MKRVEDHDPRSFTRLLWIPCYDLVDECPTFAHNCMTPTRVLWLINAFLPCLRVHECECRAPASTYWFPPMARILWPKRRTSINQYTTKSLKKFPAFYTCQVFSPPTPIGFCPSSADLRLSGMCGSICHPLLISPISFIPENNLGRTRRNSLSITVN